MNSNKIKNYLDFTKDLNEAESVKWFPSSSELEKLEAYKNIKRAQNSTIIDDPKKPNRVHINGTGTYPITISRENDDSTVKIKAGSLDVMRNQKFSTKEEREHVMDRIENYILGRYFNSTINNIETCINGKKFNTFLDSYMSKPGDSYSYSGTTTRGFVSSEKRLAEKLGLTEFADWVLASRDRHIRYSSKVKHTSADLVEYLKIPLYKPSEKIKPGENISEKVKIYFDLICGKRGWKYFTELGGVVITDKKGFGGRIFPYPIYNEIPANIARVNNEVIINPDFNYTRTLKNGPESIGGDFIMELNKDSDPEIMKNLPKVVEGNLMLKYCHGYFDKLEPDEIFPLFDVEVKGDFHYKHKYRISPDDILDIDNFIKKPQILIDMLGKDMERNDSGGYLLTEDFQLLLKLTEAILLKSISEVGLTDEMIYFILGPGKAVSSNGLKELARQNKKKDPKGIDLRLDLNSIGLA